MNPRTVLLSIALLAGLGAAVALPSAQAQTQPQTRPDTAAKTEQFKIDPVHSAIIFRINHLGVSPFYGRFNGPYGEFRFNPEDPTDSTLEVKVKAADVDTNNPNRDGHIKSADFLNAKQFPHITFKSTSFSRSGKHTYKVTGDLTFHGVTKSVTIDLEHVGTRDLPRFGYRCGFSTSFSIKRSDYGVNYMPDLLGDDVLFMIGLEGARE
ncbi:MAG: YceI family protein [Planctomycetota bacterium]|jgi:polyisoprenoid-binding protein YceI